MQIWMIVTEHGGPLSLNIPAGRLDSNGEPVVYRFRRGHATEVADEDVEWLLKLEHPDKYGTPRRYLTKQPPQKELTTEDELRMQLEHLTSIVTELAKDNPAVADRVGLTSVDSDSGPLAGLK